MNAWGWWGLFVEPAEDINGHVEPLSRETRELARYLDQVVSEDKRDPERSRIACAKRRIENGGHDA